MLATHITRRGFLKRATAAIAIIAVSRAIPAAVNPDAAAPFAWAPAPVRQPMSFAFLEDNYMRFCYGNCEPTLMMTSLEDWQAMRELFIYNVRFPWSSPVRPGSFRFNGADVAFSSKVPRGEIWYINEKYPEHPFYSGKAYLS